MKLVRLAHRGERLGKVSAEKAGNKDLERENGALRQANAIRKAGVCFAVVVLNRPFRKRLLSGTRIAGCMASRKSSAHCKSPDPPFLIGAPVGMAQIGRLQVPSPIQP